MAGSAIAYATALQQAVACQYCGAAHALAMLC
jgi:hypothetical protein